MRISDWSSDVCSSDLVVGEAIGKAQGKGRDEALQLEEALVGKVPACCLVDRLDDALVRVALAERRDAGHPVEQLYELLAGLEFGLDVAPLGRLFGELGQETRALGLVEAGRAHELEPRTRRSGRSDEHTSELQSLMRLSSAVFCLKTNK